MTTNYAALADNKIKLDKTITKDYEQKTSAKTETIESISASKNDYIELNFQNASLASILEYLAQKKGLNLIPSSKELADKKISMTTKDQMSLNDAWDALMTLMEINGYRLVKFGKLYKAMPIKDSATENMRVFSSLEDSGWQALPASGEIVTFIYYLTNMKVDQAASVISIFTGEKPIIFSDLDICIIKGPGYKIRSALEILEPFDKDQLKQTLEILKLKYTSPEAVTKIVSEEIAGNKGQDQQRIRYINLNKKDVAFLSSSVKLIPDQAHNTIIMLGQDKQIQKIREFIEKFIDVEWGGEKTRVRIKEIKYRNADQLQRTLEKIIKSTNQSQGKQQSFKDVRIVAETAQSGGGDSNFGSGNRLIISCDPEDWIKINALIENLDNLKPQIALEVMIVDTNISLARELSGHIRDTGIGILGKNVGWAINNIGEADIKYDWLSLASGINRTTKATGDNMITFGDSTKANSSDLWGLLKLRCAESNSNIISQPFMVTNNGEECNFNDQQTRRAPGELNSRGTTQVQKQENVSASNKIVITPRVNAQGIVDMQIDVTVEEFIVSLDKPADRNTRHLKTKICMGIGEVLVLGGLNRNKKVDSKSATPFAGEIPIIGNFFKSKTKNEDETSLFIFIRPSLIKPRTQVEPDDYTQFKLDYAKLNIKRTDDFAQEKDPLSKAFFRPSGMGVAEATRYSKSEAYPPIDQFSQRKFMPLSTDIKRDPYYHAQNKSSQLIDAKPKKRDTKVNPEQKLKKRELLIT